MFYLKFYSKIPRFPQNSLGRSGGGENKVLPRNSKLDDYSGISHTEFDVHARAGLFYYKQIIINRNVVRGKCPYPRTTLY